MRIIAHRGASSYYPENTFPAFEHALGLKSDAIETDVQVTKDNILVLFHDDTLERIVGIPEKISDFTLAELLEFDFGKWFFKRDTDIKIPKFSDFLERYSPMVGLDIEIKSPGISNQLLANITEYTGSADIVVTSFILSELQDLRRLSSTVKIGYLTEDYSAENIQMAQDYRFDQFCPGVKNLTPEIVTMLKELGFYVRAWGIEGSEENMLKAYNCKVDGMTVNFPDKLYNLANNSS